MVKSGLSGVLSGRIAKRCPLTSTSVTPHVVCSIRSMVCRVSWMSISSAARVWMSRWMLLDSHCVRPQLATQMPRKRHTPTTTLGTIEDVLAVENDVVPFDRADVLGAGLRPGLPW